MADTKYDYSNKTEAALEKMIQKDSGASQEQARAAYNELSKRRGGMDFSVTLILGGRPLDKDKPKPVPVPKKKPAEPKTKMAYGGMAGGKKHMYTAGGMVKDNPGLKALKKASPEAYKKITGK